MSINYNNIVFSEPIPLQNWTPPVQSGLYAVLVPDSDFDPKPFRVIYFGETGNYAERGFPSAHHKYNEWVMFCGSRSQVFIATYPMPNSTPDQRRLVESRLCANYKPSCNG